MFISQRIMNLSVAQKHKKSQEEFKQSKEQFKCMRKKPRHKRRKNEVLTMQLVQQW